MRARYVNEMHFKKQDPVTSMGLGSVPYTIKVLLNLGIGIQEDDYEIKENRIILNSGLDFERSHIDFDFSRFCGLTLKGELSLTRATGFTELPSGLVIETNLWCGNSSITSLPEDLIIGGSLGVSWTSVSFIPALNIPGNLFVRKMKNRIVLANGLRVGKDFELLECEIYSLPEGLRIGGDLELTGINDHSPTKELLSLPKDIVVGGNIHVSSENLYRHFLQTKPKGVKGTIIKEQK